MSRRPAARRLAPMSRAATLLAAALIAAALLTGCSLGGTERVGGERAATPRELTMLDPFSNAQEVATFASEVARLSGGALRIRVVDAGTAGVDYEATTIRSMQQGRADLAFAGSRAWDEFGARRLRALSAPLLIDSYRLQERVLQSELVGPMLDELQPLGLVGIGILPGPMRRPLGIEHRLASPSDFSGLTIGTQQSRVADATMRALGARPYRLAAAVPGVDGFDGIEHGTSGIDTAGLDVDGSHLMANVNLWPRPLVVFANGRSYGRLTDDEREILSVAATNAVPKKAAVDRNYEAEATGNICRKDRATVDSATPLELRALRRAVEPVYRELRRDPATAAAIESIERLKNELAEPPAELPKCEPERRRAKLRQDRDRRRLENGHRSARRRRGGSSPRTGGAGSTCSTAAVSRSRKRTRKPAPGAMGRSRSTTTGCLGASRMAAASPPTVPRTSPESSSSSASAHTATP